MILSCKSIDNYIEFVIIKTSKGAVGKIPAAPFFEYIGHVFVLSKEVHGNVSVS